MRIKPFLVIILTILITPCYGQGVVRSVIKLTEIVSKPIKTINRESAIASSLAGPARLSMSHINLNPGILGSEYKSFAGSFYTSRTNKLTSIHWWDYKSEFGTYSYSHTPNDFQLLLNVKRSYSSIFNETGDNKFRHYRKFIDDIDNVIEYIDSTLGPRPNDIINLPFEFKGSYSPNLDLTGNTKFRYNLNLRDFIDIDTIYTVNVNPLNRVPNGVINTPLKYSKLDILWMKYQNSIIEFAELFADSPFDDVASLMWENLEYSLIGAGAAATGAVVLDSEEDSTPGEKGLEGDETND